MSNPNPKNQFVKGDPRINKKGRPKSFDQLRKLAQEISHKTLIAKDGTLTTVTEAILQQIAKENPKLFLEIAYGRVPLPLQISGDGNKPVKIDVMKFDYDNSITRITPRPNQDIDAPSAD